MHLTFQHGPRFAAALFIIALSGCATAVDVDRTKKVSNVCPVHRKLMEKRTVELLYGFMYSPPFSAEVEERAKATQFPFAETVAISFESRDDIKPHYARVYICPDCVAAHHKHRYGEEANQSPQPPQASGPRG